MTKTLKCFLFAFLFGFFGWNTTTNGQSWFDDGLSPAFHKERRQALRALMPENSVAVFFTNPIKNRSNDTDFAFRPNSDFYYLTGFREPNAVLVVFKSSQGFGNGSADEFIFVPARDPRTEQWEGARLGVEGVQEKLGLESVFLNSEFMKSPAMDLSKFAQVLSPAKSQTEGGRHNATLNGMMEVFYTNNPSPAKPAAMALDRMMNQLRVIKSEEELIILKKAIEISGMAHIEAIKSIQPGVSERAIQGVHEFVHKAMGAEDIGYGSIVGAGNNSCILHYVDNDKRELQDGVILMDVGAEYRGYSGDITRTVPVKGVFSKEEKAIYEIVLKALEAGTDACKVGEDFRDVGLVAKQIIDKGLVDLGIIKEGERHPYFPHGIGHHLGLDVHDRGAYGKLEPGMVLTVEPGIYIPEGSNCDPKWWKIGVRIEDNILITETGNLNLSQFVPKTVADIEKLMKEDGVLQKL